MSLGMPGSRFDLAQSNALRLHFDTNQYLHVILITLARLRQVVTLAERGAFSKAAATLGISQPALTRSIQTLEAALGVRLFDRHTRGVVLTDFGRLVVSHTRALVAREEELLRDIHLLAGLEVGHLDVALGPYPSVISGYAAAGRVMAAHPRLQIALHVANWREVTKAVVEKRAELGIAELSDAVLNEQLDTEVLAKHRARLFCRHGHPLLQSAHVTLEALLEFPWANTRLPPRVAAALPREPVRAGRFDELTGDFVPALETDVPMQFGQLVEGNDVIAFGVFSMVESELEAGRLAYLPTPTLELRASYGFIFHRNRSLSPAAQAFMHAMREQERICVEREARLEQRFGQRRPWPDDSVTIQMMRGDDG
jgi:DNA-binding transcriptional LysR family regulator